MRLFFANKPAAELRLTIAELGGRLCRAHGLEGSLMDAGRLHITLASAWAEHLSLQEAIWRAQTLAMTVRAAPLSARFDFTGSFHGTDHHPFVLRDSDGLPDLAAFRDRLRAAMRQSGFAVSSSYTPHMTLMWADRCVEDHPIAPISWQVCDFELVLSADGDHIQLGRWPLTS
ncbi:MAG TPA: 2'-5' RNA ligase family protein [Rhizomicrobium sp.]|jgi:2'-5' RNA ligase